MNLRSNWFYKKKCVLMYFIIKFSYYYIIYNNILTYVSVYYILIVEIYTTFFSLEKSLGVYFSVF